MHDRLKRTARKRGNYLRAQPVIRAHMLRDTQDVEQEQTDGWAILTPEQVQQLAEETLERARGIRPAWNPFRL